MQVSNKNDHVIIKNLSNGGYLLECLRCGEKYEPGLPCPMDIFISICKTFNDRHRACREAAEEAVGE